MKTPVKEFRLFNRINENEENMEEPFRLYGMGENPQLELISDLKSLIDMIFKSNPSTQEEYDEIKEAIRKKGEEVKSHPNFDEFKEVGFEWQDSFIKLSDWQAELKQAVMELTAKASKKGLA